MNFDIFARNYGINANVCRKNKISDITTCFDVAKYKSQQSDYCLYTYFDT